MTTTQAKELFGEEFVERVKYIRKLYNAQWIRIINQSKSGWLSEGEKKDEPIQA